MATIVNFSKHLAGFSYLFIKNDQSDQERLFWSGIFFLSFFLWYNYEINSLKHPQMKKDAM
jgi:hypothetical protein